MNFKSFVLSAGVTALMLAFIAGTRFFEAVALSFIAVFFLASLIGLILDPRSMLKTLPNESRMPWEIPLGIFVGSLFAYAVVHWLF